MKMANMDAVFGWLFTKPDDPLSEKETVILLDKKLFICKSKQNWDNSLK